MAGTDEDRFRPRVGRPRGRGSPPRRFVSKVLKAASQAGSRPAGLRPGAARLARGSTVARLITGHRGAAARRVTVKVRLVVLAQAGARSVTNHLTYIERDAVGRDGEKGVAYDRLSDHANAARFEQAGRDDRHQFRLIVAPEDGEALGDLRTWTRNLMGQVERDLGTTLDWIAVDHHDTGHPHVHVVLRGVDDRGKDLVIARDYVAHGFRARASELATDWLGPRSEREIRASIARDTVADRWTGLDRGLVRDATGDGLVRPGAGSDRFARLDRLRHLESLGLAEQGAEGWRLSAQHEAVLRDLAVRGDIVRTLQRAVGRDRALALDGAGAQPIIGRIAAKGLADELGERAYLAVDGIDGRAHYLKLPAGSDLASWPIGGIVEARAGLRDADRAIAAAARDGIFTPVSDAPGRAGATAEGQVRRLEALRRAGIVERLGPDSWRIPEDLVAQGAAHDARHGPRVILRSTIGIDVQARAIGATWLDHTLVDDETGIARAGFGAEVHDARTARIALLEREGLARRSGAQLLLARDLLATLRARDLEGAGSALATETGLAYRPAGDGRISGTYVCAIDRPSGRFAMLDDGAGGFALVPWRPVIEHRLGQTLGATVRGSGVSWEVGRTRGLSL